MASLNQYDDVAMDSFALEVSSDARRSGTANRPIFTFSNNEMNNVCGIALVDALVPFSYNTVLEGYNNQMLVQTDDCVTNNNTYSEGFANACTFMLVFKNGNYTASNISAYIQNEIDNLSTTTLANGGARSPGGSYLVSGNPSQIKSVVVTSHATPEYVNPFSTRWVVAIDPTSRRVVFANYRNLVSSTANTSRPDGNIAGQAKGITFRLHFGPLMTEPQQFAGTVTNVSAPIADVMGFRIKSYSKTYGASQMPYTVRTNDAVNNPGNFGYFLTADETPNFVGAPKLVLRTDQSSLYGNYISANPGGGYSSGLASIIVPVNPNKTIIYENPNQSFSKFADTRIDRLELWWTYGNTNIEVDFNGVDWSVQFRLLRRVETSTNVNRNAMGDRYQRVIGTGSK